MEKSAAIMELVSNYNTYADAGELNVTTASDAPATSPACAVSAAASAASSWYCVSAASGASVSATAEANC
ncbi:LxmA leader domain family RiPP [Actinopolyspora mortivallis]|uniref:Uncharacterized protein n=1 Tax=Actinopolyspora mortivallis TaxID=33906 RepID=A0A2T0GSG7_ACTMO|nr:LxmA leader domain family RiPP [Actinopolyspora mortivallis]PRW62044.1 hypothetical protein CEP50_17535 [Actinopolyspora mortivallis]